MLDRGHIYCNCIGFYSGNGKSSPHWKVPVYGRSRSRRLIVYAIFVVEARVTTVVPLKGTCNSNYSNCIRRELPWLVSNTGDTDSDDYCN